MLSNQQRGRNISNDTAVQSVYLLLQNMYPELNRLLKSLDDKQGSNVRKIKNFFHWSLLFSSILWKFTG